MRKFEEEVARTKHSKVREEKGGGKLERNVIRSGGDSEGKRELEEGFQVLCQVLKCDIINMHVSLLLLPLLTAHISTPE